jgi:hypothetical protein
MCSFLRCLPKKTVAMFGTEDIATTLDVAVSIGRKLRSVDYRNYRQMDL